MFALWYLGDETTPGTVTIHNDDVQYEMAPVAGPEELAPDEDGDDGLRRLGYRRADDLNLPGATAAWHDEDDIRDTYAVDIRPL